MNGPPEDLLYLILKDWGRPPSNPGVHDNNIELWVVLRTLIAIGVSGLPVKVMHLILEASIHMFDLGNFFFLTVRVSEKWKS